MICKTCGAEFDGTDTCPVCGSEVGQEFGAGLGNNDFFAETVPAQNRQQSAPVSRARYCTHCGHRVHEEAVVCVNCGCAVDGNRAATPAQQNGQTNGMAIAGFVCSFLVPILGWVFGGIGLSRAAKMNGKGKSLSIAAIAIASANFILSFIINMSYYL